MDAFLAEQKLTLVSQLLPSRDNASVHYPKGLSSQGKEAFVKYLDGSDHKAFVMSGDGPFGWRTGQKTTEAAVEDATGFCRKNAPRKPCRTVMIDNEAVDE